MFVLDTLLGFFPYYLCRNVKGIAARSSIKNESGFAENPEKIDKFKKVFGGKEHENGCSHRRRGACGYLHGDRDAEEGQQEKNRHRREGEVGGKSSLSESQDAKMYELQALLPYHDGLFGRGRVLGRKTVFELRGRGRSSSADRRTLAQDTIDYTDQIYLEFGADEHIEGLNVSEEVKEIRKRAIQAGLKLVDCPIRHMGTEKAQSIYLSIGKISPRPWRGDPFRLRMQLSRHRGRRL